MTSKAKKFIDHIGWDPWSTPHLTLQQLGKTFSIISKLELRTNLSSTRSKLHITSGTIEVIWVEILSLPAKWCAVYCAVASTIYVLLDKRKYSRMTWPLAYIGTSFLLQAIGAIPTNSSSINLWRQWSMRRLVNLLQILMGLSAQPLRNLCQQPAGHNGCRSGSPDAKKRWVPGKQIFIHSSYT